jgi:hypothetical protein
MSEEVDLAGIAAGIEKAQSLYPNISWALKVPELAGIILKAAAEQWDEGRIRSAIQSTDWWRERTEAQRRWDQLLNTDPAEANRQVELYRQRIEQWAGIRGIALDPQQIWWTATIAAANQFNDDQIAAYIVKNFTSRAPVVRDHLNQLAADYVVPLSEQALSMWEEKILKGEANQETFVAYLREQAKSLFPSLAPAIDRGITVRQYAEPYAQIAVRELGINPADIDWRDPKWAPAIHRIDPNTGEPVSMSLAEWTRELRSNPIYGFDDLPQARELASALGDALKRLMGRAA